MCCRRWTPFLNRKIALQLPQTKCTEPCLTWVKSSLLFNGKPRLTCVHETKDHLWGKTQGTIRDWSHHTITHNVSCYVSNFITSWIKVLWCLVQALGNQNNYFAFKSEEIPVCVTESHEFQATLWNKPLTHQWDAFNHGTCIAKVDLLSKVISNPEVTEYNFINSNCNDRQWETC